MLANVLASMDRLEEAEHFITLSAETGSTDDGLTQIELRTARAEVLLRRGEVEAAMEPAREAVEIADGTDVLNSRGNARRELARVFGGAGQTHGAVEQALLARGEYERKGNIVSAREVQRFLDELG
jgi:ATP/maltotriose-dependent transcriptional regulator MalT